MIWYLDSTPVQKNQECAVPLGIQGENQSLVYTADVSDWLALWPSGVVALVLQAPDKSEPYMGNTSLDRENGVVTWTITNFDTSIVGYGFGELRIVENDVVKKSYRFATYIRPSILASAAEPPAPIPDWINDLLEAADNIQEAVDAAEAAQAAAETAAASALATKSDVDTLYTQTVTAKDAAVAAQTGATQSMEVAAQAKADAVLAKKAAVDAQDAAELAARNASMYKDSAFNAKNSAQAAQTAAETAQGKAETAQTAAETAQGKAEDAQGAAETALASTLAAKDAAINAITAQQATSVAAVQAKGTEVIASIPQDYSALSGEVSDLKSAIDTLPAINLYRESDVTTGYIAQDGTTTSTSGWNITDYMPVNQYSDCYYQGITIPGGAPYSAFYKSDKSFISTFKQATGINTISDIPYNAAYVRFSVHNDDKSAFGYFNTLAYSSGCNENAANVASAMLMAGWSKEIAAEGNYGKIVATTGTEKDGWYSNDKGAYNASANFKTLLVEHNAQAVEYYYSGTVYTNQYVSGVIFFNADMGVIDSMLTASGSNATYTNYKINDIPVGTKYIAFGSYIGGGGTLAVSERRLTGSAYSQLDFVITGDSIETQDAGRWAEPLRDLIGFKSYTNKAVGGTCMAKSSGTDTTYIASDNRMALMPDSADIVLVGGGTNDWANNIPLGSLDDLSEDTNFAGAVYSLISKLQTKYPNALIVFTSNQNTCSPNRHNFTDATGWVNNQDKTAADYADMMEKVCRFAAVPYIDTNHNCGINRLNYTMFILQETNSFDDVVYMHPNDAGSKRMLRVIYRWFVNNKPVV